MIKVLKPVNNRKCDFCGSDEGVYVLKFSSKYKRAYCKNCRKDLDLDGIINEATTITGGRAITDVTFGDQEDWKKTVIDDFGGD